jgi:type VI secretion system protein ImpK
MNIEHLATRFQQFTDSITPAEAQPLPTPIINKLAYHRTKLIYCETAVNALLNAASPLFSLIHALKNAEPVETSAALYRELCHEISALEHQLSQAHYPQSTVLTARFALCVLIDETIMQTAWGKKSNWQSLLQTFHPDYAHADYVFAMIENSLTAPAQQIELIELFYVCLSLGLSGKYRYQERGLQTLTELRDLLYENIQQQRGEVTQKFQLPTMTVEKNPPLTKTKSPTLWRSVVGAIAIGVLLLNAGLFYTSNHQSQQISQQLQRL